MHHQFYFHLKKQLVRGAWHRKSSTGHATQVLVRMVALCGVCLCVYLLGAAATFADQADSGTSNAPPAQPASDKSWHEVSSKHGQFTVLMPGEVQKSKHESEQHQSTNYFSQTLENGKPTDFFVSHTTYESKYLSKRNNERLLREAMEMHVSFLLGKVVKKKYFDWNGSDAIEFDFAGYARSKKHSLANRNANLHGRGRIILAQGTEYALICTTTKPSLGADCAKFFQSFKLNQQAQTPALSQ